MRSGSIRMVWERPNLSLRLCFVDQAIDQDVRDMNALGAALAREGLCKTA